MLRRYYGDRLFVFGDPMSLQQSKDVFSRTRLILGVHGGAMYNLHFAPRDTIVVEYLATESDGFIPDGFAHSIIWRLAQNAGQTFYRIPELPLDEFLDLKIDLQKLIKVLDKVDSVQFGANRRSSAN